MLTSVIVSIIGSSYKDLIDTSAKESLKTLSVSIFETLYVSMNYGDNEVVNKVLTDLQNKKLIDRLEIYRNKKIDELFETNATQELDPMILALFDSKEEQYFDVEQDNFVGVRFLKPLITQKECLACHTNMSEGEVLGIVDLMLSLKEQMRQGELLIYKIVFWILTLVAISGVILHFVSKSLIFTPINDLQNATKRLTEANDLDMRVAVRGVNEFGEIAHHFNRFIARVKGMHEHIEHLLADSEAVVKEQTKELKRYIEIIDKNVITSKTDTKGIITYASHAFCEVSGYTKEELIGKPHNIVRHQDTPQEIFKDMWETLEKGGVWSGEVKNLKKDGGHYWVDVTISPLFDDGGKTKEYVAIRHDVTIQKELESTLDKLTEMTIRSHTDALTGLHNRNKLNEAINSEIARSVRYGKPFSLAIMDVDHFKSINDTYGHLEGDFVLKEIAKIISNKTRKSDVVGRWGGEEFLIIFIDSTIENAKNKCDKIRHWIELHDYGIVPRVTASFGVAGYCNGDTIESLIARADKALYVAKETGRNKIVTQKEIV